MNDDPLMYALNTARRDNPVFRKYIGLLLDGDDFLETDSSQRILRVQSSTQSKMVTYHSINPTSAIHPIYKSGHNTVDDYLRITFTRFRTSSHRLKIETGRWSRVVRERRVCQCGNGVQTEEHVLVDCQLAQPIRDKYGHHTISFQSFMAEEKSKAELSMLHEILKLFEI